MELTPIPPHYAIIIRSTKNTSSTCIIKKKTTNHTTLFKQILLSFLFSISSSSQHSEILVEGISCVRRVSLINLSGTQFM